MPIHLRPFNWRLFASHCLAIPLLILGGQQLQIIRFASLTEIYQRAGAEAMIKASGQPASIVITSMQAGPLYAWGAAILLGCCLSALVVWHRGESRLLPVLLLGAALVSSWTHYYQSQPINRLLAYLRWPLEAWPVEVRLAVVGGALVLLGLLPFLLTWRRPHGAHV